MQKFSLVPMMDVPSSSPYQVYLLLVPVALTSCLTALGVLGRRDGWIRAKPLVLLLALATGILVFSGLELLSSTESQILLWSKVNYTCIVFCPVAWFCFALNYVRGRARVLKPSTLVLLCLIPVVTMFVAWTNEHHQALWVKRSLISQGGLILNVVKAYGPWFWVHLAYSYALYGAGTLLLLVDPFFRHRLVKTQSILIFIGATLPFLFNAAYVLRLIPSLARDFSPLALAISGLLFALSVNRYGLFSVQAGTREWQKKRGPLGVVIVDDQNRIVDLNNFASEALGLPADRVVGAPFPWAPETKRVPGNRLTWRPWIDSGPLGHRLVTVEPDRGYPRFHPGLTRQESSLLSKLSEGATVGQIAQKFHMSEATVQTHIDNILRKMKGPVESSGAKH